MSGKQYKVIIYERFRKDVLVEAFSEEEALLAAENAYTSGDVVLEERDYDGPEFLVSEVFGADDLLPLPVITTKTSP